MTRPAGAWRPLARARGAGRTQARNRGAAALADDSAAAPQRALDLGRARLRARHLLAAVPGPDSFLVNHPEGISRVLVDNHANYGRTPASIRILRPILGDGLFLADGADWRHQRRTLAPAFAPRSLDVAAGHIARPSPRRPWPSSPNAAPVRSISCGWCSAWRSRSLAAPSSPRACRARCRRARRVRALRQPSSPDPPSSTSSCRRRRRARSTGRAAGSPATSRRVLDRMIAERAPHRRRSRPAARPVRRAGDRTRSRDRRGLQPTQLRDQIATLTVAGHETTALTMFWSAICCPRAGGARAGGRRGAGGRSHARCRGRGHGAPAPHPGRGAGGAAALPARVHDRAHGAGSATSSSATPVPNGSLVVMAPWILHRHRGAGPIPSALTRPAFCPAPPGRPLRLPAVRHRPACLHRRPVRADRGHPGPGPPGGAFRLELVGPRRVTPVAVVTTVPDRAPVFRLVPR